MSPMVQDYDIYADETYILGHVAFAFGALICSPRRAEILAEQLQNLKNHFSHDGEVKWKKTSYHTLQYYKAFVNVFFDDKYARFSIMKIVKGAQWQAWASSEEERFFKSYYVFLLQNAGPSSRYNVYLDEKTLQKSYRWDKLHFLINRSRRSNWGLRRRNLRILEAIDSKSNSLLQLTDLLLGSLTSNAGASAKAELRRHVVESSSRVQQKRIRIMTWTPRCK